MLQLQKITKIFLEVCGIKVDRVASATKINHTHFITSSATNVIQTYYYLSIVIIVVVKIFVITINIFTYENTIIVFCGTGYNVTCCVVKMPSAAVALKHCNTAIMFGKSR